MKNEPKVADKKLQNKELQLNQQEIGKDFQADNPFGSATQMKKANPFGETAQLKSANESGMPDDVKTQMEGHFQADFSDVKIHQNSSQASDMGALAYTQGNDVHFAQGKFDASSQAGKALLGHELTHVVQQRESNIKPNTSVAGMAVNNDAKLEAEADSQGAAAASFSASQGTNQMKMAKANNNNNAPVQMKLVGYDEYYNLTYMGMTATRGAEVEGIDKIMKEYVIKRTEAKQFTGEASNKTVLTNLLDAAERYIDGYIQLNTASTNKTQRGRSVKFQTVLGKITEEKTDLAQAESQYGAKSQQGKPIKITSTMATDEALIWAALAEEDAPAAQAPQSRAERKTAEREGGMTEAEDEMDQEEKASEKKNWQEDNGMAGELADATGFIDDTLGGDDRSGLADFGRDDAEEGEEEKEGLAGTNGKEIDGPLVSNAAKEVYGYTADSVGTTRSLVMLGFYLQKTFKEGFTPQNVYTTIKSLVAVGENGLSLASNIAGSAGNKDVSETLGDLGGHFGIASAFFEVFNSVKGVYHLFKDSKDIEEQKIEAQSNGKTAKVIATSEKMIAIGGAVKNIVIAIAKTMKLFTEDIPGPLLDAIPGLDIAIAGINFIQKGASIISTKMSISEIDANQKAASGELGEENVAKLQGVMRQEKDLRAKKANLEMLYESDGELLRAPGTPMKDKKVMAERRRGTKIAMDQVDAAMQGKDDETNAGLSNEQKMAAQEYKSSAAMKEQYASRYPELAMGMITDGMRIAGGMMVLLGPSAPIGAILKGVAGAMDLGMKGGSMIVNAGRDSKAKDKAIEMSKSAQGGGNVTGERQAEGMLAFNENKSTFAQSAEKKNLVTGLLKQVDAYKVVGGSLNKARQKNGVDKALLESYTGAPSAKRDALAATEQKSGQAVAKIAPKETRLLSGFRLAGVDLKALLANKQPPQTQFKLMAKRIMTNFS